MIKKSICAIGFICGIALTLQSGYAETKLEPQPSAKPGTEPAKPTATTKAASLTGKVVETFDSGGYTYINMEKDGKTFWVALPATKVVVGKEIEVRPGTQMGKFTSKALNRTFDEIIFSPGLTKDAVTPLPPGHQPISAKPQGDQKTSDKVATPQQKGNSGTVTQPDEENVSISGKVVETIDTGKYTYIRLENKGKKAWGAIPVTKIKVGQKLSLQPGTKMYNITSKSLNKTFDSVVFSKGLLPAKK